MNYWVHGNCIGKAIKGTVTKENCHLIYVSLNHSYLLNDPARERERKNKEFVIVNCILHEFVHHKIWGV